MQRWLQQVLNGTASIAQVVRRGGTLVIVASTLVTGTGLWGTTKSDSIKSLVVLRSPSDDLVQNGHYHAGQFTDCRPRDYFRVAYKFQQSIHGDRFAESLFGDDKLLFLGSTFKDGYEMPNYLPTKDETGIYADWFGLSPNTNATMYFRPRVQNNVIHFILHMDLCDIFNGLYVHLDAPLVNSRWQLRQSTQYCYPDGGKFANKVPRDWIRPGLVGNVFNSTGGAPEEVANPTPPPATITILYPNNFDNYLFEPDVETLQLALSGQAFGKVAQWKYGRFFGNDEDTTRLAAFNADLGYSAYAAEDAHVGIYFKVSAPAGTHRGKTHAGYIFGPTVGDPFWKIGGGLTGHITWFDECHDQSLTLLGQAYLTRWGHAIEWRTMDFKNNGALSRYLMLKEFWFKDFNDQKSATEKNFTELLSFATGNMFRATEYTTRRVKVGVESQGEGLIELVYRHGCGFSAGLGYNIYGKSGETVELCKRTETPIDKKPVGITSGIDQVMGFQTIPDGIPVVERILVSKVPPSVLTPTPWGPAQYPPLASSPRTDYGVQYLTATQSDATMYNKGNTDNGVAYQVAATGTDKDELGYMYLVYSNPENPVDGTPVSEYAQDQTLSNYTGKNYVPFVSAKPDSGSTEFTAFKQDLVTPPVVAAALTTYDINFTPDPVTLSLNDLDVESAQLPGYITNKFFAHMGYEWADCDSTPYLHGGFEVEIAPDKYPAAFMSAWAAYLTGGVSF